MARNKHELPRTIPVPVKLQVRQECFFGCVVCGAFPYDYDHLDPEFADATEHNPAGITLLCRHHHGDKGIGISRAAIRKARAAPFNKGRSAIWPTQLDGGIGTLLVGNVALHDPSASIVLGSKTIIGLRPPQIVGDAWSLDGDLRDLSGEHALRFRENEIHVSTGMWDVEKVAGLLTLRSGPEEVAAKIRLAPDEGIVAVDYLRMGLGGGWRIEIDQTNGFALYGPNGYQSGMSNLGTQGFTQPIHLELKGATFFDEPGWETVPADSLEAPNAACWFAYPPLSPEEWQVDWQWGDEVWSCYRGGRLQSAPTRIGVVNGFAGPRLLLSMDGVEPGRYRLGSVSRFGYWPTHERAQRHCDTYSNSAKT